MHRRVVLRSMLALACVTLPLGAQLPAGTGRAFGIDDALGIRSARIEDVSDDGRWVALTVRVRRDALGVDHSRFGDPTYVAPSPVEFELIDATNGQTRSIVPGKVQVRGATFTKDGTRLAFLLRTGDDWALHVYDVGAGRVRRVALHSSRPIASNSPLVWAPDGRSMLLTLRPNGWADSARAAFVHMTEGPIVVQDASEPFLSWEGIRNLNDRQIPAIVTISDGGTRELLPETPIRDPRFSPDGSSLLYSIADAKKTAYERSKGTDYGVFRLRLADGALPDTLLAPVERRIAAEWNDSASAFAWTDRGNVFVRWLAADSARNLTENYRKETSASASASASDTTRRSFRIESWHPDGGSLLVSTREGYYLLDARSDSLRLVYALEADTATRPNREFVRWSRDGREIYFEHSARDRWARGLELYDVNTQRSTMLIEDANLYSSWHVSDDGSRFVFQRSDGDRPNNVYAAGREFADARALTNLNPQLDDVAMSHSELVSYLDVDGKRLHGVLYYPYNYEPGKKYPLVAEVYETYFDNGYSEGMSLLAGRGYFVLHPSVDLEIGYPGEAWVKGVTNGINSLIERGLVDGTKLGVEGTSYGGYAVNLLITQTNRFAAAVNISGKVDLISFLGDSPKIGTRNYNAAEEGQDRIGATLWEAPLKYIQHSAIMFADRIRTPLLMLTGKQDWNVPDTNEREMYYALRRLGREAVWVQYTGAGHGAGRSGSEADFRDHWARMFGWFDTHFEKGAGKRSVTEGSR